MKNWIMFALLVVVVAYLYLTSDYHNLKCVIAHKDGNTYCVRDSKQTQEKAELLAEMTARMNELVDHLKTTMPNDPRVKLLVKNFNPKRIVETLPTSEYTAYSEDKGKKLAFCLEEYKGKQKLIDLNTLMFVSLHEMGHLITVSIGHESEFWKNFQFLLKHANSLGLYEPVDYAKNPQPYCGMTLTDNPLVDLK
jgi:hypothetical protein